MTTYNVLYSGKILSGFDPDSVQKQTTQLLKLSEAEGKRFFSGKAIPLKKGISLEAAEKLKNKLEIIGLSIKLEPTTQKINPLDTLSLVDSPSSHQAPATESSQKTNQPNLSMNTNNDDEYSSNPYSAPRSQHYRSFDESYQEVKPPNIFNLSLAGRYGRLNMINASWVLSLVLVGVTLVITILFATASISTSNITNSLTSLPTSIWLIFGTISLVSLFYSIKLAVLRLHDLNRNGLWSLLIFSTIIPVIGYIIYLIFYLYLLFAPGDPGKNEYGPPSTQGPIWGLAATIFILGSVLLITILMPFSK